MSWNNRTKEIVFTIVVLFMTVSAIAFIGNVLYYNHSGADRSSALRHDPTLNDYNQPYLQWLEPSNKLIGHMSEEGRNVMIKDYLTNWKLSNFSLYEDASVGLSDYYTHDRYEKIKDEIPSGLKSLHFKRADLSHHIKINFISADGELVNFTDYDVEEKYQLLDKKDKNKIISRFDQTDSYNVTILLDDGYWRVKSKQRIPSTPQDYRDTSITHTQRGIAQVSEGRFTVDGLPFYPKGINYYPKDSPWELFGEKYNPEIIDSDFKKVREMGFNTVRVFLNFHDFIGLTKFSTHLHQLHDLLGAADKNNVKVILTLFDFMGNYNLENYSTTDRQVEDLFRSLHTSPSIFAIDIKNEPDIDYYHHDRESVRDWLAFMIDRVRRYDPNHLITIGWAYPENADYLAEEVDFVSFHSYRDPEVLKTDIVSLRDKLPTDKIIVLEEFGKTSYKGIWNLYQSSSDDQKEYYTQVLDLLKEENIPFVLWSLYDYKKVPTKVVGRKPWHREPQKNYGILDSEGNAKGVVSLLTSDGEDP